MTKSKISKLEKKRIRTAYLFLSPVFLLLLIFVFIPVFVNFYISFTKYSVFEPSRWVGLSNYIFLIQDSSFLQCVVNTLYFMVGTVLPRTALALLLAIVLNRKIRGRAVFRSIFYLPVVTATFAVSFVWIFLYDPSPSGLFNYFLSFIGVAPLEWLGSIKLAMPCIILMSIWKFVGYYMVIFLAGLQGIPEQLYEASRIDGANKVQEFWHITLPLLKPVTLLVLILSLIGASQVFEQIYAMTQGGPGGSTMTIVYKLYITGFRSFYFGRAAAMSFFLVAIVFTLSIINMKLAGRRAYAG